MNSFNRRVSTPDSFVICNYATTCFLTVFLMSSSVHSGTAHAMSSQLTNAVAPSQWRAIKTGSELNREDAKNANGESCNDAYDNDGTLTDNLNSHEVLASDTGQIDRSLCGFYDADYIEFPARANVTYRIEVLDHQSPKAFGMYLQLLEKADDGTYNLVGQSMSGTVFLNYTTTDKARNLLVRISSTVSDAGRYGGGDYRLSLSLTSQGQSDDPVKARDI